MADNNDILKAIESIKSDVANIKKDMVTKSDLETVKKDMATKSDIRETREEIRQKIEKEAKTTADFFHETWNKLEKLNDHETRISQLEEEQLSTHKN